MDISINHSLGQKISDYCISQIFDDVIEIQQGILKGLASLKTKTGQVSVITEPKYLSIDQITNNLFKVKTVWGGYLLINKDDRVLTYHHYEAIDDFEDGIFIYKRNKLFGLMNDQGKEVTKPLYKKIISLGDGFYLVRKEYYQGIIDKNGKQILDNQYSNIYYQNNYFVAVDHKYGLYDVTGNQIIDHKYQDMQVVDNQTLLVKTRFNTFKLIDFNERVIKRFPIKYHDIEKANNNLWKCKLKNNHYTLIDSNNKEVLKNQYYNIQVLTSGLIIADHDIVNSTSVTHYDYIYIYPDEELLKVELNRAEALLDYNKNIIVPYHKAINLISDCEVFVKDNNYKLYNFKTKKASREYDRVYSKDSMIFGYLKGKYYLLNNNYEATIELNDFQFHFCDLEKKHDYLVITDNYNSCYTLIDKKGNVILENVWARSFNILDDDKLIVDNYIYNINDLKNHDDLYRYVYTDVERKTLEIDDYNKNNIKIKKKVY